MCKSRGQFREPVTVSVSPSRSGSVSNHSMQLSTRKVITSLSTAFSDIVARVQIGPRSQSCDRDVVAPLHRLTARFTQVYQPRYHRHHSQHTLTKPNVIIYKAKNNNNMKSCKDKRRYYPLCALPVRPLIRICMRDAKVEHTYAMPPYPMPAPDSASFRCLNA